MRIKEINAIERREPPKDGGYIIDCYDIGNTLVIDCWYGSRYIGRYAMRRDGDGDIAEYGEVGQDGFRQKKLQDVILSREYSYWSCNDLTQKDVSWRSSKDRRIADGWISATGGANHGDSFITNIYYSEMYMNRKKRDKAIERKCKRIDAEMSRVPMLPADFEAWAAAVPFGGKQYMFQAGKGRYACTVCGKVHRLQSAKNNRESICPATGTAATVDKVRKSREATAHAMVLQELDERESIARHFTIRSTWTATGQRIEALEDVRYFLPRKKDEPVRWFYRQGYLMDELEQEWYDRNRHGYHTYRGWCYPGGAREALAGTRWERCGIPEMAEKGWKIWYNRLMIEYEHASAYEYFAKLGLRKLAEDTSDYPSHYFYVRKGNDIQSVLGIDGQQAFRLKRDDGGITYLAWLRWERAQKRHIKDDAIRRLDKTNVAPGDVTHVLDRGRMTPEQIANYIERQVAQTGKTAAFLLEEWRDIMAMAKRLKLDDEDEIVYRPRDLVIAHDRMAVMINREDAKKTAKDYKRRFPAAVAAIKELTKYEWSKGDYAIVAPRDIADIVAEGRALNHCVVNDRYIERIAKRESYILFLRRASDKDVPWYTLEVEPGGVIRQKRTRFNRQEKDLDAAKPFLVEWQREIVRRMSERERALAKKSEDARRAEIDELRKTKVIAHGTNTLLAEILEQDLMTVTA